MTLGIHKQNSNTFVSSAIPAGIYHYLVRKNCYEGVKNSDPSSKHGKNLCPVGKGPASKTGHWNEVIVWYGRTALDEKKKQTMSSVSHAAATLHSEEAVDVLVVSSDMEVRDWTLRKQSIEDTPKRFYRSCHRGRGNAYKSADSADSADSPH